jgi:hypothetical protein
MPKVKLFERSSKDSAILRRAFAAKKDKPRSVRFAGDDSHAGGVEDDEVMKLNRVHDAPAFDRGARRAMRGDATRQRALLNITGETKRKKKKKRFSIFVFVTEMCFCLAYDSEDDEDDDNQEQQYDDDAGADNGDAMYDEEGDNQEQNDDEEELDSAERRRIARSNQ